MILPYDKNSIEILESQITINIVNLSFLCVKTYGKFAPYNERLKTISKHINAHIRGINKPIVINAIGEGVIILQLVKDIIPMLKCDINKITIIGSVEDYSILKDYNYIVDYNGTCNWYNFYTELQKNNIDWKNIQINKALLSLTNRPNVSRAMITKYLLDNFKNDSLVSFGLNQVNTHTQSVLTKEMYPYELPIVIDKNVSTLESQHLPPNDIIHQCLVQIVNETLEHNDNYIFVSEKSFKVFAWHQLPIFVTVQGHVQKIRELGFDVFDDIFDGHLYDKESFSNTHTLKIFSTIKKFMDTYPTLEQQRDLRNKLWTRIEANNSHLAKLVAQSHTIL